MERNNLVYRDVDSIWFEKDTAWGRGLNLTDVDSSSNNSSISSSSSSSSSTE